MAILNKHIFCACVTIFVLVTPVYNAPKSRKQHGGVKFDQKQTGDYNIQLHLKDFQIVALLGEDALGSYGDYDYYDYADLTIKPIVPSTTTAAPQESFNSSSSEEKPEVSSQKPNANATTSIPPAALNLTKITTTRPPNAATIKVEVINDTRHSPSLNNTKGKPESPQKTTRNDHSDESNSRKAVSIVPMGHLEPSSSDQRPQHVPLGEIMHYKKCSEGYTRDKRGRCRKIRRTPQLPFGISRFASNLAARFRQAAPSGQETLPVNH